MCDPQRKNDNNKTTEFILKVRPGGGNWSAVSAEQGDGAMPVEAHASCGAEPAAELSPGVEPRLWRRS